MIHLFFLFPQSDDDLLSYAADRNFVINLVKCLHSIRFFLRNNQLSFSFVYDSNNLRNYTDKLEIWYDDKLIKNDVAQIVSALGRNSIDICSRVPKDKDHLFWLWDKQKQTVVQNDSLLLCCLKDYQCSSLFSFCSEALQYLPQIIVLEDCPYKVDYPLLHKFDLFALESECRDWIKSFIDGTFHLNNNHNFTKMPFRRGPKNYYRNNATGCYWCYDYFHKDNREHYEVFNKEGIHLGEADTNGNLIENSNDSSKNIYELLH